jgi:hypothetical protein
MEQRYPMMQRWAAHVCGVKEWFQSLTAPTRLTQGQELIAWQSTQRFSTTPFFFE